MQAVKSTSESLGKLLWQVLDALNEKLNAPNRCYLHLSLGARGSDG